MQYILACKATQNFFIGQNQSRTWQVIYTVILKKRILNYRQLRQSLKARANARNIVGQQDATLLGPTCCERLHTMLCVVATCWKLLDEVWNWSNFRANKCQHFYCFAIIEAWSNNVAFVCTAHPTMLRRWTRTTCHVSTQIHANKK